MATLSVVRAALALAFMSLAFAIVSPTAAADRSDVVAGFYPRDGAGAAFVGGYAYVFGGHSSGYTTEIVRYDPLTNDVRVMGAQMPEADYGWAAATDGTDVYFVGGGTSRIFRYEPAADRVVEMQPNFLFTAHYPSIAYDGTRFWIFESFPCVDNTEPDSRLWTYDPVADELALVRTLGDSDYAWGSSMVWTGSDLVIVGGRHCYQPPPFWSEPFSSTRMAVYNTTTEEYRAYAFSDGGRWTDPAIWDGKYVWVFGGNSYDDRGPIVRFDPVTGEFRASPADLDVVVEDMAAVWTGRFAFVFGGLEDGRSHSGRIFRVGFSPDPPADLTATAGPGQGEITLAWTPPNHVASGPVTSYRVTRTQVATSEVTTFNLAATTSFVDSGLPNGATFTYVFAAENEEGGLGVPSAAVGVRTLSGTASAPLGLAARVGPARGQIELTWQPPRYDGDLAVTTYRVQRDGAFVADLPASARSFVDGVFSDGEVHEYRAVAVNAAGSGALTLPVTGRTVGPPTAPLDLVARTGPGSGRITLDWSRPANDGGSAIVGFRVDRDDGASFPALAGTPATFAAGDDGFALTASPTHGSIGRDAGRQRIAFSSDHQAQGPVGFLRTLPARCSDGSAFTAGDRFSFSHSPGQGGYVFYLGNRAAVGSPATATGSVQARVTTGPTWTSSASLDVVFVGSNNAPRLLVTTPANPSWTYEVEIAYDSTLRTITAAVTASGAPVASGMYALAANEHVDYDSVGAAIDGWRVNYNFDEDPAAALTGWVDDVHVGGACSPGFVDTGLPPGVTHAYLVTATNADGPSAPSVEGVARTIRLPTAPASITATATDRAGTVALRWTPSLDTDSLPLLAYRVFRDGVTAFDVGGYAPATRALDTGAPAGSVVRYTVAAVTDAGVGPESPVAEAPTVAVPSVPSALTASPGAGGLVLTWAAPAEADSVASYAIDRSVVGGATARIATIGAPHHVFASFEADLDGFAPAWWAPPQPDEEGRAVFGVDRGRPYLPALERPLGFTLDGTDDFTFALDLTLHEVGISQAFAAVLAPKDALGTGIAGFRLESDAQGNPRVRALALDDAGDAWFDAAAPIAQHEGLHAVLAYDAHTRIFSASAYRDDGSSLLSVSATLDVTDALDFQRIRLAGLDEEPGSGPELVATVESLALDTQRTTASFVDLTVEPGVSYAYSVTAASVAGAGPASASSIVEAETTVPSAPRSLAVAQVPGNGVVDIRWAMPASDGGHDIASYKVYRRDVGPESLLGDTTGLTFTDSGLEVGRAYRYRVAAVNALGEGPRSVAAVFEATGFTPDAPRALSAVVQSGGKVRLDWQPPVSAGTSSVDSYVVLSGPTSESETHLATVPVASTTDFAANAGGFVRVADAPNSDVGWDATNQRVRLYSDQRDEVDERFERGLPEAVDGTQDVDLEARFALVDHGVYQRAFPLYLAGAGALRPGGVPGTAAFTYDSAEGDGGWEGEFPLHVGYRFVDTAGATRLVGSFDVAPGVVYGLHIRIAAGSLTMEVLDASGARIQGGSVLIGPGDVEFTRLGIASDHNADNVPDRSQMDAWVDDIRFRMDGLPQSFTDTGIARLETRWYRVAAVNAEGVGVVSDEVSATNPAVAPTVARSLVATRGPDVGQISLAWAPPADGGGYPVVSYDVYGGATTPTLQILIRTTATEFVHSGLPNGTQRLYRIVAVNDAGSAPPTALVVAKTFSVPSRPPRVETDGFLITEAVSVGFPITQAVSVTVGDVTVTWDASTDLGGYASAGYRVWRAALQGSPQMIADVGTGRSFTETPPTAGTYDYSVTAYNPIGESARSPTTTTAFVRGIAPEEIPDVDEIGLPVVPDLPSVPGLPRIENRDDGGVDVKDDDATFLSVPGPFVPESRPPLILGGERVVLQFDADDHDQPLPFDSRDSSGAARHANYGADRVEPEVVPGRFGEGYGLGRTNQWIDVPESASDALTEGSFSIWVNMTAFTPGFTTVAAKVQPGVTAEFVVWVGGAGEVGFFTSQRGGSSVLVAPSGTVETQSWTHLVVTWGGAGKRIYVDGELVASNSDTVGVGSASTLTALGADPNDATRTGFAGAMDEVRFYDRALGQSEVRALTNAAYAT